MSVNRLNGEERLVENLFDFDCAAEVKQRVAALTPEQQRQWGKMSVAQMLAHCSKGVEMAAGETNPPRAAIGRILGLIVKPMVLRDGEPMRKNSPTIRELITDEAADFDTERARLNRLIDQFRAVGPVGCTSHPHPFFGRLAPEEWAQLMYKHLDHHLRQFGV